MTSAGSQASSAAARATTAPASVHRPLGWTLFAYIAREAAGPTALALGGLTVAALTKSLLGLADLLVNRGLSTVDTASFIGFEVVVLAARIFPFAVLLGALIALGRLSADKELLALESCGVAPGRLVGPVIGVGCIATLLGLGLSLGIVPATLAARERLLIESTLEQPGSVLRAGVVKKFGPRRLSALEASSRGDDLRGVMLHADDLDETFFAESAALRVPKPGLIELTLRDGVVVTDAGGRSQLIRFKLFRTELKGKEALGKPESEEGRYAGASTSALWSLASEDEAEQRAARTELARRFSTPFAALALTWLAVPLALLVGSASRGAGGVIGLAVTVVYYGLLQASNALLEFKDVSVAFAVWMPNVLAALGGGVLMLRRFLLMREQKVKVRAPDARDVRSSRSRSGHRFPLTRYVARRYVTLSLLAFGVLLLAYLLVDVLEHLERFAEHEAELSEVIRFYAARIPLLASRVMPMGLLVGTALLVSGMSVEGELIGMEACGIRLVRGLASLLVVAALATPAYFVLTDRVLPQTNALADRIKDSEIKGRAPGGWEEQWSHTARIALHVGAFNPRVGIARQMTLYELGPTGLPETRLDARIAHYVGHERWRLIDSRQTIVGQNGLVETTTPEIKRISSMESLSIDPMHEDLRGLAEHIRESKESGYDLTAFQVDFQTRLAAPLQCLLLPWIGLLVAITARKPAPALLSAVGLGVGFILLTGVSGALGYGGWLPPILAGWLPSGAVAGAAAGLHLRR